MSKIDLSGLRTAEQKAETAARADQERINAMARQYLSDTDWYETREHREGKPIPTEVLESRRKARAAV
ncbi:MAG: hypothetical protein ABN482_09735, partial [Corticimicrobacter sp.]|uniref:hypothetical protein n=1 Tax=Corticimicrobacter sp. TaxID=2678536 RepID=UPI0032DBDCAB